MKHRWLTPKFDPRQFECSTCRIFSYEKDDTECLAAHHDDPAIDKLYRDRRHAAEAADGSGPSASNGWATLEEIQNQLRTLDPDGDWYYEGNLYDGQGWMVRRR